MQMSNVNAKQATRVHLFHSHSHSHSHSLPPPRVSLHSQPFGPAFLTVATCCLSHPIRLERCYYYLLAAHKQLALLAIGMPQHAKVSSHFSFVFSHPHPIPFAVAALRLADCTRLHFWKFGIRCEQKRTQVSNIWLIWIGTNCFWFTEALQDVSNEHKIWFNPPHPRCSMGHTNATTLW